MPKLPDFTQFPGSAVPRATRGVQNVKVIGEGYKQAANIQQVTAGRAGEGFFSLAEGAQDLGQSLYTVQRAEANEAARKQAADDKMSLARARAQFLRADIRARNGFEGDQDFKTYGTRYETELGTERAKILQGLRPDLHDTFLTATMVDSERGRIEVLGKARAMEESVGLAELDDELAEDLESSLQATDEPSRAGLLRGAGIKIEAARDKGWLTPLEAQARKAALAVSFATGRFAVLTPPERLEALTRGMTRNADGVPIFQETGTLLDRIPIETRIDMINTAQEQVAALQRERRLADERQDKLAREREKADQEDTAIEFVDRLWDSGNDNPLTYGDVANSNLTYSQRVSFYKLLDLEGAVVRTDHTLYNQFYEEIARGEIRFDQLLARVMPSLGRGIAPEDYSRLYNFAREVRDTDSGPMFKGFLHMAKSQLSASVIMGAYDPVGDRKYYEFLVAFHKRLAAERAAGTPVRDLLDPDHDKYLGAMINFYQRSERDVRRDVRDARRGEVPLVPEGAPTVQPEE